MKPFDLRKTCIQGMLSDQTCSFCSKTGCFFSCTDGFLWSLGASGTSCRLIKFLWCTCHALISPCTAALRSGRDMVLYLPAHGTTAPAWKKELDKMTQMDAIEEVEEPTDWVDHMHQESQLKTAMIPKIWMWIRLQCQRYSTGRESIIEDLEGTRLHIDELSRDLDVKDMMKTEKKSYRKWTWAGKKLPVSQKLAS